MDAPFTFTRGFNTASQDPFGLDALREARRELLERFGPAVAELHVLPKLYDELGRDFRRQRPRTIKPDPIGDHLASMTAPMRYEGIRIYPATEDELRSLYLRQTENGGKAKLIGATANVVLQWHGVFIYHPICYRNPQTPDRDA